MYLYIHDYTAHIGQLEVARALALDGHDVVFSYCDLLSTPRAELVADESVSRLTISPISIGQEINKLNYFKRQWQDWKYGRALVRDVRRYQPDIVISANNPLVPQWALVRYCRKKKLPFLHWWTDVYSRAVRHGVGAKYGPLGRLIAWSYEKLEVHLLRSCQAIIGITPQFQSIANEWNIETPFTVIPVLAPTNNIRPHSKQNPWAQRFQLSETFNILYCGTLGLKHNPEVLFQIAQAMSDRPDVRVVVIAQGVGADRLRALQEQAQLPNLRLFPYQPFEEYANVLATGDVHLSVINRDAAEYALPSKVMSQLSAGRPQVAIIPETNLLANVIRDSNAGRVFDAEDFARILAFIHELMADDSLCDSYGMNGRRYVEQHFSVESLLPKYEQILCNFKEYPETT